MNENERVIEFDRGGNTLRTGTILTVLALVALALRLFRIGAESLWLDEAYSLQLARSEALPILLGETGNRHTPPLYYFLLHFWRTFGESEAALRTLSAILGAAAVPVLYLVGKRTIDRRAGLVAAAAAALSPFLVYYGQEARGYTLLILIVSLSSLALLRFVEEGRWRYGILFALLSVASLYTHYYGGFVLVASNLFAIWELRRNRKLLVRWIVLQLAIALVFLPWVLNLLGVGFGRGQIFRRFLFSQVPYSFLRFNVGYGMLPLTNEAKRDVTGFLLRNLPLLGSILAAFGFLLIRGAARLFRKGRNGRFLLLHLAVPYALALLVSLRFNLISERYLLVAFPFYLLILVEGIRGGGITAKIAAAAAVVLLAAGLQAHYFNPRAGKTCWREAARVISSGEKKSDAILLAPSFIEVSFGYYYRGGSPVLGLRRPECFDMERFEGELASLGDVERYWLVISHIDSRDFYTGLLAGSAEEEFRVRFPKEAGITVALFERRAGPEN